MSNNNSTDNNNNNNNNKEKILIRYLNPLFAMIQEVYNVEDISNLLRDIYTLGVFDGENKVDRGDVISFLPLVHEDVAVEFIQGNLEEYYWNGYGSENDDEEEYTD